MSDDSCDEGVVTNAMTDRDDGQHSAFWMGYTMKTSQSHALVCSSIYSNIEPNSQQSAGIKSHKCQAES